jgi:hypothetical protein
MGKSSISFESRKLLRETSWINFYYKISVVSHKKSCQHCHFADGGKLYIISAQVALQKVFERSDFSPLIFMSTQVQTLKRILLFRSSSGHHKMHWLNSQAYWNSRKTCHLQLQN